MMRKVTSVEELTIPFTYIETQDDGVIIDIPLSYNVEVEVDTEDGIIIEQSTVDVDPTAYGEEASWKDVMNLGYFDLQIGKFKCSRKRKNGFKHMGLKNNKIGLVKYNPVYANGKKFGNTKKTIIPKLVFTPPLEIIDGYISVNGASYETTPFKDMSTGQMSTLSEIKRIAPDGSVYPIICKVIPDVEELI